MAEVLMRICSEGSAIAASAVALFAIRFPKMLGIGFRSGYWFEAADRPSSEGGGVLRRPAQMEMKISRFQGCQLKSLKN